MNAVHFESPLQKPPRAIGIWRDGDDAPLMVQLPEGEFLMGENARDKFADDTERPAHRVLIVPSLAIGCFPVTVGEFRQFRPEHSLDDDDDLPVVNVSWCEACAYCGWLTEQTGREYRLPSEAEWEFACRSGSRAPFSSGEDITVAEANFLYDEHGTRIGVGHRTPVGSYPPNAFGFHDFHGDVCEWVADAWHPNYIGAPQDGRPWLASGDARRVIRGGAWDYLPRLLRSSWRDWRLAQHRADNVGFRVATDDSGD